jgi:uncharacterized protein involved in exopolysaccharide biosynthesis
MTKEDNNDDIDTISSEYRYEGTLDFKEIFSELWDRRRTIIILTIFSSILSIIYALSLTPIYKSEALLIPNSDGGLNTQGGSLSSLANDLVGGGLSGILGGGASNTKSKIAMQTIKSRKFAVGFIQKRNILVPLMAAKSWEETSLFPEINPKIFNIEKKVWYSNGQVYDGPNLQVAAKKFTAMVDVQQDRLTGIVALSVQHPSAAIAKQWTGWIIQDINEEFRRQDQLEAQSAIDFLTEQQQINSVVTLNRGLSFLIEQQLSILTLTKARKEYILKILDPPVMPLQRTSPKRTRIVVAATIVAGFLSVIIAYILFFFGRDLRFSLRPPFIAIIRQS